jgi:hypothetical protein
MPSPPPKPSTLRRLIDRLDALVPLPHPHFMAFAPLDVWARMLLRGGAITRIRAKYWPRLAGALFTSALGTALTLPERIAVGGWLRLASWRKRQSPVQVICILGYFRSGTTHLHYLLSCDPAFATPRWHQVLAPQGFILSWGILRWFLVPFLASTRPQDDVAIGPEWPAEDDFALCSWCLGSSLPGRMVLPGEWEAGGRWARWHTLEGSSEGELCGWRFHTRAFAWKVSRLSGGKPVLLKNPSHTARVRELARAFGAGNIRFIHLARDPAAVLRSNLAMHGRFGPYLLQALPGEEELRRRITREYTESEAKFEAEAAELPPGTLARMRYDDLVARPVEEMRRVYSELGLVWTEEAETRMRRYLDSVRDYRAASAKPEPAQGVEAVKPARESLPVEPAIAAMLMAAAWVGIARITADRLDWLVWPVGAVLGTVALRVANKGSVKLGLWAAALTLAALLTAAYPATAAVYYRDRSPVPWADVWDSTRDGLLAANNLLWLFLGVMTAYRLASRKQAAVPGD